MEDKDAAREGAEISRDERHLFAGLEEEGALPLCISSLSVMSMIASGSWVTAS